ncbi:hypothetical protein BC834DRAFT_974132 [Gloeopeniophorella convolvens]|nr:hypothetical protein BC834DRAFT_974132 [Gloeopeniophorella convolvens]
MILATIAARSILSASTTTTTTRRATVMAYYYPGYNDGSRRGRHDDGAAAAAAADYYSDALLPARGPRRREREWDPYDDTAYAADRHHHRERRPHARERERERERSPPRRAEPYLSAPYVRRRASPTYEPYDHRPRDRSPPYNEPSDRPPDRSPTPPPLAPPAPTPAYLALAASPSLALPTPPRKLLILDLNGTLVLRSSHASSTPGAPRHVTPRPYLGALRGYLFARATRAWLDVMVWSSAQPHSVRDMVMRAFGRDAGGLVAVWARDTLGLAADEYHRKVQTIKDLARPWAALAPHDARSTLLLDDSRAKAARQPYNHVCVPEYTAARRRADLAALARATTPEASDELEPEPEPGVEPEESERTRRRKEKKRAKQALVHTEAEEAGGEVDETLLRVVGVLHAARAQSNVAGWLRAGALGGADVDADGGAEWFEDAAAARRWADAGRAALRELGLDVEHGVEP